MADTTKQHKRHSSPAVRFASPSTVERIRATMSPRTTEVKTTNNHHHHHHLDSSIATAATNTINIHNNQSMSHAFTPILTPNRSGSMVMLLSPARTISESLTSLATSTGQQLEQVWDQVGYSPEDRASQISDLLTKFHDICEQKIAEEKGVAETFRQTIAEQKDEIYKTAAALKLDVESLLPECHDDDHDGGGGHHHATLTDELAAVEATLEGLRGAATLAREDLKECRDFLMESHQALGLDMDPKWNDIESDLTSSRRAAFHEKRAEMKEQLTTRTAAVLQLVRDCQHLMGDLRIEAENGGTDLDRRIAGSVVRSKDDSFIMASKFRSETCVGINSIAMEELTNRVAELSGEKRRRKHKLQEMGAEIALLWEKLRVSEEEQIAFTESVQGLGKDTIEKGESELKRLHALKSQMLGKLIHEARQTITDIWDQINTPPDHRRSFEPFAIQSEELFTDELLEQHEAYIVVLEARLEQMKPILRLIERREIIVKERMEYENLQKDPDRLKQRGAELTRQLMEEEKMARRIKRDLPKLTELLNEKLDQWRKEHGEHFEYCGETYLKIMDRQEQEWSQYKEEKHHLMLIKKQEDKALVDSRFAATHRVVGPKKAGGVVVVGGLSRQPLGDAQKKENARHAVVAAVAGGHDAAASSKPAATIHPRTMGAKQSSLRFKS